VLEIAIQCHREVKTSPFGILACRDSVVRGLDTRFPYCATGRPNQPFGYFIYSANRGMELCAGAFQTVPWEVCNP